MTNFGYLGFDIDLSLEVSHLSFKHINKIKCLH
ncbi:MAG: hypothetical protein ACD_56C00014G0003 [uncultured bacterium]|nr:MAG: hypothetical protein ACD_56C00014G0003 [uncultured bacterium]